MRMNRRQVLGAAGLSLLLPGSAGAQGSFPTRVVKE